MSDSNHANCARRGGAAAFQLIPNPTTPPPPPVSLLGIILPGKGEQGKTDSKSIFYLFQVILSLPTHRVLSARVYGPDRPLCL